MKIIKFKSIMKEKKDFFEIKVFIFLRIEVKVIGKII